MKGGNIIDRLLRNIALSVIGFYQHTLSPDKSPLFRGRLAGKICAHEPHCSEYAKQCFQRYTFFSAVTKAMERIASCVPSETITYDPSTYRVVFFSSAPIGVPFLHGLAHDPRFELIGVVTMPDAPVGRGMHLQENVIKQETKNMIESGIISGTSEHAEFIHTPRSLRLDSKKYGEEAKVTKKRLEAVHPDLCVIIAYGNILPQYILDIPEFGSINVHGSVLPEYRGASPLQSVFLDGKTHSGITVMKMDAGIDTGEMIATLETSLPLTWTVKDLIDRIKQHGPSFLTDTLRKRGKGVLVSTPQDDTKATFCRKFEKEDGLIDPLTQTALEIWKKRQAFALWPKLYFFWQGKRITIDELEIRSATTLDELATTSLIVRQGENYVLHPHITHIVLKPEGKKGLTREQFVHGYGNKQ